MLRKVFRCDGGYLSVRCGVFAYGRRPLFLFLLWRAGGHHVHELCNGHITPGLVIVSYLTTCFARRSEVRCRGLLKMEKPFRVCRSGRGPACHSLRFAMMEVLVVLSQSHLFCYCRSRRGHQL